LGKIRELSEMALRFRYPGNFIPLLGDQLNCWIFEFAAGLPSLRCKTFCLARIPILILPPVITIPAEIAKVEMYRKNGRMQLFSFFGGRKDTW
jgi:hypothetical protein